MANRAPRPRGRARKNDPAALAAILPESLRAFASLDGPQAFRDHHAAVAEWLDNQAPGHGELARPVMAAAGLTVAEFYWASLTRPVEICEP